MDAEFWAMLDRLVDGARIVIDRPRGSAHPRYPHMIYPMDYGYLEGTKAMDGGGIDLWLGSGERRVNGVICTVDIMKRDSEIKLMIGCTEAEMQTALALHNDSEYMKGLLIRRPREE